MDRQLIIDADGLFVEAAFNHQVESWWTDEIRTVSLNVKRALSEVSDRVADLKEKAEAQYATLLIGGVGPRWRSALWPAYKSHRRPCDAPIGLAELKECAMKYMVVLPARPGYEADDFCGELMGEESGFENVLYSPDKDLFQIPGPHLLETDGEYDIVEITLADGNRWHMVQTLTGDSTDGYPGCPGIGPVKAERILEGCQDWWAAVVGAYEKADLTEQDALVQARVACILRGEELPGTWLPPDGLLRAL